jgi:hypothetical protein
MNRRVLLIGAAGLLVVIAGGALVWWLASPLFINRAVSETFPEVLIEDGQLVSPSMDELAEMSEEELDIIEEQVAEAAADMPDKEMEDPMPEAGGGEAVVLLTGSFLGADDFHQGSGTATIYQLPDGSAVLRLEDFSVTNGPDLHVFLSGEAAPLDHAGVMAAPSVDLGALKGNLGDQNYDIPAGTDLSSVRSVVIYCVPFRVVFATATLS